MIFLLVIIYLVTWLPQYFFFLVLYFTCILYHHALNVIIMYLWTLTHNKSLCHRKHQWNSCDSFCNEYAFSFKMILLLHLIAVLYSRHTVHVSEFHLCNYWDKLYSLKHNWNEFVIYIMYIYITFPCKYCYNMYIGSVAVTDTSFARLLTRLSIY